jgi:glutathione synthase/RimK-type ligase-like ATP-grasp enzyme
MKQILILKDYRNQFWLKSNYKEESVDLDCLKEEFENLDYDVILKNYAAIDFKHDNYDGWLVFYQSSEDPDLFYKSYIEDILLGLKIQGATLIPEFCYFRAHHNKVFMEILRELHGSAQMKTLRSWCFGTFEDYCADERINRNEAHVFKLAAGAQSKNVELMLSREMHFSIPKKNTLSFDWYYWIIDQIKPFLKNKYPSYRKKSHLRKKFIIQEFVQDLDGDFKVLIFWDKLFVLTRKLKEGDFRASGSGKFSFSKNVPFQVLEFSLEVFRCFDAPFIGLDVGFKNGTPYLLEFQFVNFGTYTAEKAPHHFKKNIGEWTIVEEP